MSVTRFAPSPTGYLHLGHAFAAMVAWENGDHFLLRIEDLDQGRAREEFVSAIFEDLNWLGLNWGEPVMRQSARMAAYRSALDILTRQGLVYPCFCTRKEIAEEIARAREAPHLSDLAAPRPGGDDGPIYPGTCRTLSRASRDEAIAAGNPYVQRLDAAKAAAMTGPLTFTEYGKPRRADPLRFGDIVLARRDVPAAYHLAVVVDDAFQGVTLVTRGEDLLPATHVQRLLQTLLSMPEPHYAHHRLILDDQGRKFSKRDQAVTLRALRAAGVTPEDILARLGL
ncbi:MAG TPA: tRNA glutamyl-Q(34) synthetase GluQRS [Rhizomicrobium sp.]|nr:tRNA glutamyl-Q(34) synthetase GluQRS [Rhizomicrobium sp.]